MIYIFSWYEKVEFSSSRSCLQMTSKPRHVYTFLKHKLSSFWDVSLYSFVFQSNINNLCPFHHIYASIHHLLHELSYILLDNHSSSFCSTFCIKLVCCCQAQPSSIQLQLNWLGWIIINFNFYPTTHPHTQG